MGGQHLGQCNWDLQILEKKTKQRSQKKSKLRFSWKSKKINEGKKKADKHSTNVKGSGGEAVNLLPTSTTDDDWALPDGRDPGSEENNECSCGHFSELSFAKKYATGLKNAQLGMRVTSDLVQPIDCPPEINTFTSSMYLSLGADLEAVRTEEIQALESGLTATYNGLSKASLTQFEIEVKGSS